MRDDDLDQDLQDLELEGTMSTGLLDWNESVLVVIDVQERYIPHLYEGARVVEATRRLIEGAKLVGVPVLVTEQYPEGLGHTTPALRGILPAATKPIAKRTMSCVGEPDFVEALRATERAQVVIAGIEAQACVNQTVHDLLSADCETHIVIDAMSSRFRRDYDVAVERQIRAGAIPTTVEAVLLEWVRTADAPEFQKIRALIRDPLPA
ncbi:MAG: isochorismatase family protein [Deltaproteobacteria bacterium]|nr:isochorismatase family protein [Deltaproteobacteria bacterium]